MAKARACGNANCGTSTGIHDGLTFGHGKLDKFGYWSKPCRLCAADYDQEDKSDTIATLRKSYENQYPDATTQYIERILNTQHAWLYLPAWPYSDGALPPDNQAQTSKVKTMTTAPAKPAKSTKPVGNNNKKPAERPALTLTSWFERINEKYAPMLEYQDNAEKTVKVFGGLDKLTADEYADLFHLDDYSVVQAGVKNGKHAARCWNSVILQPKKSYVRLDNGAKQQ